MSKELWEFTKKTSDQVEYSFAEFHTEVEASEAWKTAPAGSIFRHTKDAFSEVIAMK